MFKTRANCDPMALKQLVFPKKIQKIAQRRELRPQPQ